ncbi:MULTISPECIES: hypothetical protein [unclassified Arcicella]|uniref:rolling circle replication-associated protein n=1 Tax=unclassified Arcicella TaxID=2644986 RepID=UPI002862CE1A|nr:MULTISPECIES: hypothetical protein [unclassified Arcicella]MDR6564931.1 hypothetical protein [Arcicella sp. BE51]MDR6814721.1 hypothetical protein [Arcicella sp. BE140]MDR6826167.1 hypothetical protein [Arcicella sp. BE139]
MIQYDILGGKTLVKEYKAPQKKKVKAAAKPETNEIEHTPKERKSSNNLYMTIEKKVKLSPHRIVSTTSFCRETKSQNDNSRKNLKACDGEFNGYMSANTSRYVKRIVENWLTSIELNNDLKNKDYRNKPYVTFVTLTLPSKQVHHDNYLKNQLLDPMIEWLRDSQERTKRKGAGVDAYLWRAESQKNGNLHFHLIVDRWIDQDKLRQKWNQILERLQYISMYRMTQKYIYRKGFVFREEQAEKQTEALMYVVQNAIKDQKKIPDTKYRECPGVREILNSIIQNYSLMTAKERKNDPKYGLDADTARMLVYKMQLAAYERGMATDWDEPNTTDVHKLSNIESISAYITKYVSKKDGIFPVLAKNQKVLQNGNMGKYIFTLREGGDWENAMDWMDEIPYEVKFESRKVRGRIWGKSRNLSDTHEGGSKIESPSFTTEIKMIYDDEVFGRRQKTITQNEIVNDYVEQVKQEIPEAEIKRLAEIIDSEYCEIIPLGEYSTRINHKTKRKEKYFKNKKQVHFLEKLNPTIKIRYLEHYNTIFQSIYGNHYLQKTA